MNPNECLFTCDKISCKMTITFVWCYTFWNSRCICDIPSPPCLQNSRGNTFMSFESSVLVFGSHQQFPYSQHLTDNLPPALDISRDYPNTSLVTRSRSMTITEALCFTVFVIFVDFSSYYILYHLGLHRSGLINFIMTQTIYIYDTHPLYIYIHICMYMYI